MAKQICLTIPAAVSSSELVVCVCERRTQFDSKQSMMKTKKSEERVVSFSSDRPRSKIPRVAAQFFLI